MSEELHKNPEFPVELPYRRVLDHGFVALVDVMGDDSSIVQAARVSYGKGTKTMRGDKALISYLMRHFHSTPTEMVEFKFLVRLPVFVARQWIRHRTACLAEGTEVHFESRKLRIEDVWGRRNDVRNMRLLQVDEDTLERRCTRVVDVHRNGRKPVFRMTLADGKRIEATADHRFLFADGWHTLREAAQLREDGGRAVWNKAAAPRVRIDPGRAGASAVAVLTEPVSILGFEFVGRKETYDLEVEGPYHNFIANGIVTHNSVNEYSGRYSEVPDRFWAPSIGMIAEQDTVNRQGRGDQLKELVEALPDRTDGAKCRYLPVEPAVLVAKDGSGISRAALLRAEHRIDFAPRWGAGAPEGMLPTESYVWWTEQLLDFFPERKQRLEEIRRGFVESNERCYAHYLGLLESGVAREIARCVLPLTMYTEWYWKIDLHNLFHFLRLRMDAHAQLEIRAYAEAMAEYVKPVVPFSWEAFEQDRLQGTFLSSAEREVLRPVDADAQREVLTALHERGYRGRRLKEVCRKLAMDERIVDELWPPKKK